VEIRLNWQQLYWQGSGIFVEVDGAEGKRAATGTNLWLTRSKLASTEARHMIQRNHISARPSFDLHAGDANLRRRLQSLYGPENSGHDPFADLLSRIDRVEDRGRETDLEIDTADLPELS